MVTSIKRHINKDGEATDYVLIKNAQTSFLRVFKPEFNDLGRSVQHQEQGFCGGVKCKTGCVSYNLMDFNGLSLEDVAMDFNWTFSVDASNIIPSGLDIAATAYEEG